jgi:hypothetical protein
MPLIESEIQKAKLLLEEWKTTVDVQMHFNDMLMRLRTTGISIVLAFFGAASISLQYSQLYLQSTYFSFHAAVLIISSGLVLLVSVFVLDYFYYYKMLLGSVERGYQIDKLFSEKPLSELTMMGMSTEISRAIGKPHASKYYVWAFYGLVLVFGIVFIIGILLGYVPPAKSPA